MKPLSNRSANQICNFKLIMILYTILVINIINVINAAPTTNSPSKLSPSITFEQLKRQHNQNLELLLSDKLEEPQPQQSNGDNFDQFEISTTTIPIESIVLNKILATNRPESLQTTTTTTNDITTSSSNGIVTSSSAGVVTSSSAGIAISSEGIVTSSSDGIVTSSSEGIPKTTIVSTSIPSTTKTTSLLPLLSTEKPIQKSRKLKTRLGKKLKEKSTTSKYVEPASIAKIVTADTFTTKDQNKSNEDVNIRKLFEKSTTTTATTTGMTTENLDSQSTIRTASDTTTLNPIVATTNAVPIVIDYLTTTQTNPFDELLNLNDQKVEEALQLVKNTFSTTDKLIEPNKIIEQIVNAKEDKLQGNKIIPSDYSSAVSSPTSDNTKFLNANEEKKLKHYENKKSHMAYKKKLRQKLRNYNHSKMIADKKETVLLTTSTTSTSVPISSTTNDITNPIFLPTTNEASVVSISTSSADPFSKLNTKTVNPFRHQDAIDDISVSDTVSATTLETTTVETPLAMASATSTQQTTSADTFQLKTKQSSISSLLSDNNEDDNDRIDDNIPKYISISDDLITTYSTQLQSSSSSQSSTVQPSLSFIKSQLQTSTKDSLLLTTTELLTNDSTTNNTLNKIVTTQETIPLKIFTTPPIATTTTIKNSESDDTLSSLTPLSSTEKELISISTSNPIFTYNPTPLRGTTKSYESSSSPTTFMARDQLKYTDDEGSNIELVTTKFITDYPKFSSKNIDNSNNKKIDYAVSSVKHENTKLPERGKLKINSPTLIISSTSTTEPPTLIYEHKNRIEAINEYKTINSKKLNNKDNSAIVNDNNENANFNTLVQMKDILPYKITVADLSTTAPSSSVSTQEKNISNENEYTISTRIPTVTTIIPTSTIDTRSKENTFYSTLKNTFRSIHTTTGSSLEKDISILDTGIEENTPLASTTTATTTSDKTEKEKEELSSEEQTTTIKENGGENNFFTTFPSQTTTTAAVTEMIFSTEKLIKLTDVENIDSAELIKTDIIAKNISDINKLLFSTKTPNKNNTTTVQTSIGHDGLKATKKKQLLEKHFKTLTDKDDDVDTSVVPEHKLGPLRMKETVLKPKTEESVTEITESNIVTTENIKVKTIEINTTLNTTAEKASDFKTIESPVATSSSLVESSTSPKSSAEIENDSTVMLDIDLISDNSKPEGSSFFYDSIFKLKPAPTVQPKTTTESDYIKHKNYEKSLIPKLEWIPIASVEHFDFTDFSRSTTINYPSSTDENERKAKLAVQLSADTNDSQTKSIEIELVEPTKSNKQQHQSEVVPEFFEISKQNSQNQNTKTGDKENSESSPIEIQINVSEGFGNENENLEFSFRQMHSENAFKPIKVAHTMQNPPPGFQEIGEITIQRSVENQSADSVTVKPIMSVVHTNPNKSRSQDLNSNKNNEPEEILQVEITAIDNSTGIESFNEPKFTLHSETNLNRNRDNDDFFIPDLKLEAIDELKEESKPLDNLNKDNVDRDSDTIFYISNTEVKVAESKPTPNSLRNSDIDSIPEIYLHRNKTAAEINRSKLESQFFPTIYEEDVRIDVSKNRNSTNNQKQQEPEHYEEDIILSPLKSNFDPLKMEINSQRNNNDNSLSAVNSDNLYPLSSSAADVSYVGETLIEIEESTNANPAVPPLDLITYAPLSGSSNDLNPMKKDTDVPLGMIIAGESAPIDDMNGDNTSGALLSDVIIQPAVIPEMSIGVPVIGELPPQIELKEIDYIPSSTNNGGGGKNQQITEQIDGGAIQYGGDLISDDDTSGSAGSRYVFESSYPFGDERIRKVGRLRNEQNFDNDASDIDDNDSNSSSRDDDGFNSSNRRNINKIGTNPSDNININNDDSSLPQQQIVMHALNSNFQKEQFIADFPSYDTLKEIPQKRNNMKDNSDTNKNVDNIINLDSNNSKNHTQEIINLTTTQIATNNLYNTTTIGQVYGNGSTGNTTEPEQLGNATAFIIMDDAEGNIFDLTDIQTLLIACFATLIPLVLSLLLAFAVRYLWKKYRRDEDPDEEGGLVGDTSIDPMASKSGAMSQDELRTTESGYTLNRSNDTLDTNATDLDGVANGNAGNLNGGKIMANHCTGGSGGGTGGGTINTNNNSCGANGSVTTMTLKNNHLIVETEERNDISRDARETKMHYNSSDKDGVFVVEVARGADTTGAPNSPYKENHIGQKACSIDVDNSKMNDCKIISKTAASNHEEVQIHQPPSDNFDNENPIAIAKSATISELDEANLELEERGINIGNSKTGLSQSDLSSSSNDSNKGYNYGKQELYTTDIKISSTSLKPKLSSDSLDSIKDKSENDFGDNCDTETSPYSREYSNDSGRNKEHKNKDNCNDPKNNKNNSTSNMDKCESSVGDTTDVIIGKKADAKNPSQNQNDIKPISKDNGNDLNLDETNEKDDLKIIVENHCTDVDDVDGKNIKIENESTNTSSNKNSETIDTNDSLPPPPPSPPQNNKEIPISSNNQQSDGQKETKEIGKENENGKTEAEETKNDNILNSSTTVSTTEPEDAIPIVKEIELENKNDNNDEKTNEKNEKNAKIIHHENGFNDDDNHQYQSENHDDKNNSNSNHLTNGHYEKQNGIIHNNNHNNDNDFENNIDDDNDDDNNNDDETIIVNDDKKMNGCINEDPDRTLSVGGQHENGFDSILSLPDPPSTEEINKMNDIILMENSQLDSLPPPPPLDTTTTINTTITTTNGCDLIGNCNNDDTIKNSISIGNCGIDTNIKNLLNGEHTTITTLTEDEQQKQQHQNGIIGNGTPNGTTTSTLVAVNGSS